MEHRLSFHSHIKHYNYGIYDHGEIESNEYSEKGWNLTRNIFEVYITDLIFVHKY